jgi:hypothetical protein
MKRSIDRALLLALCAVLSGAAPEVITSVNPMPQAYALQQPVDEIETLKE